MNTTKEYIDFINDWKGRRMTLADFCEEYAQWERNNLGIDVNENEKWPVLDNGNGTMALVHTEGVLWIYQTEGQWDHDPNPEVLYDTFPEISEMLERTDNDFLKDVLGIELEPEKSEEDDREYFILNYNGKPCKAWVIAKDLIPNLEGKLYALGYMDDGERCRSIKIILD